MNFGNIGFMELMVILVIVLVLFGAKRVPEIGASIGKGIREFKRSVSDTQDELSAAPHSQERPSRVLDASAAAPRPTETNGPKRLSE
jgi:sec-independent protein translocase protein TatA